MRIFILIAITSICLTTSGCTFFEHLAPHQLWKLNRQPAIGRDDAYFNLPPEPKPDKAVRQCAAF